MVSRRMKGLGLTSGDFKCENCGVFIDPFKDTTNECPTCLDRRIQRNER